MKNKQKKNIYYPGNALPNNSDGSEVVLSNDVIASVIKESAEKVDGFIRFSENVIDGISKLFNMTNTYNGITVHNHIDENNENIIEIDLSIVLESGLNIADICYNIRNNVLESINKYLNILVSHINIYVSGIENNNKLDK